MRPHLKSVVHIASLLAFLYHLNLIRTQYSGDDACLNCLCLQYIVMLRFIWLSHKHYVLSTVRKCLDDIATCIMRSGWIRIFVYLSLLSLMACSIIFAFDMGISFTLDTVKEAILTRFEDNIFSITEDRADFQKVMLHPSTEGRRDPELFYQLFRYPMEDVQMKCSVNMTWPSGGKPFADQIVWRRNGVPLEMTDRHSHRIVFKDSSQSSTPFHDFLLQKHGVSMKDVNSTIRLLHEYSKGNDMEAVLSMYRINRISSEKLNLTLKVIQEMIENDNLIDFMLRMVGLSRYQVNSTLTIYLLEAADFGSYTCHVVKHVEADLGQWIIKYGASKQKEKKQNTEKTDQNKKSNPTKSQKIEKNHLPHFEQCMQNLEIRYFFQDVYTWKTEFRLIELAARQEVLSAPPGAILAMTSRYWHLSRKEDVAIDYIVDGTSYMELCSASLYGCSRLLLMYWYAFHDYGSFGQPPLKLFTIWKTPSFPAEEYHLVHCLCKHAYGYHQIEYYRNFYNRTSGRSELIEILHPHELVVIPRDQDMLDVFVNRSNHVKLFTNRQRNCCHKGGLCQEFQRNNKETADSFWEHFNWKERLYLLAVGFLATLVLSAIIKCSAIYSRFVKRQVLFPQNRNSNNVDAIENGIYDVFLSYSDADANNVLEEILHSLEQLDLNVFVRDRDISPSVQEFPALSSAIEKSKKFILFLSGNYFQERHRRDFEAAIILESVYSRSSSPGEVLLINLDSCQVPLWLKTFPVHDWTQMSREDKFLDLTIWLARHKVKIWRLYKHQLKKKISQHMLTPILLIVVLCFLAIRVSYAEIRKCISTLYSWL